jgi:hypothetical protein
MSEQGLLDREAQTHQNGGYHLIRRLCIMR